MGKSQSNTLRGRRRQRQIDGRIKCATNGHRTSGVPSLNIGPVPAPLRGAVETSVMNASIADRLALVLKHNGPSLLDDPDSLRRLLAPAQNPPPPEVQAILAVLKSNAVQYLQKWDRHTGDKAPYTQVREHIAGSMARAGALDANAAAWALDAWMRALMLRGDAPRLNLELEPVAPPPDAPAADAGMATAPAKAGAAGQAAERLGAGPRGQAAAPARAARLTPLGEPVAEPSRRPHDHDDDARTDRDGGFIPNGRGRPISHGWHWIAEGWHIFTAAPLMWIVTIVLFIIISTVTAVIPIVGQIAGIVLTPVLIAGLMIGAARMGKGDTLQMWESTRIERKADGSISFFAQPRGVPAAEFPLVAHGDGMIEFANPAHDYPQRIRYWREGRLLKARISLIDGSKPMEWSYAPLGGD